MPSKKNRRNKKKIKQVAPTNKPENCLVSNQEENERIHPHTPNDRVVPNGHPVRNDHHECTDGHNHSHQHSNASFNQNGQQHPAYDSTGNTTTYTSQQTVTSSQTITTTSQTVTSSQYYRGVFQEFHIQGLKLLRTGAYWCCALVLSRKTKFENFDFSRKCPKMMKFQQRLYSPGNHILADFVTFL